MSDAELPKRSRKTRRRSSSGSRGHSDRTIALQAVDFFLFCALCVVPFLIGGRIALGEAVLALSAAGAGICWGAHLILRPQRWIWSRAEWLLAAIVLLMCLQITPLPNRVLSAIAPEASRMMFLWNSESSFHGDWSYLSLTIGATRRNVATGLAYVILFVVTLQRVRTADDAGRLLRWFGASVVVMSLFALIQFLTANGLYYWFYKFPGGTTLDKVKGAFPNKNHFAQYAALAIGPMLWWCMTIGKNAMGNKEWGNNNERIPREVQSGLLVGGLAIILSAMLLARSRGAVIATVAGTSVMMAIFYVRALLSKRLILALFGLGGLTGAIILSIGYQSIVERLDNWDDSGRYLIWNANLKIISDFPLFGAGIGSHQFIHHRYLDQPYANGEYTHAESSYLQIASETGLIGAGIALACLIVCFYWCLRAIRISKNRETTIAVAGITCSLIVSCVQSLFDFVWYIQGCMIPVVILMACLCRLYQTERPTNSASEVPRKVVLRPVAAAFASLMVIFGGWMLGRVTPAIAAEQDWRLYRYLTIDATAEEDWRRINGDIGLARNTSTFRTKLLAMHRASSADPQDGRFHLRLGLYYHALFHLLQHQSDNPMTLADLQDAALNGGYESHEELQDWVNRVAGENIRYAKAAYHHLKRSAELNPLEAHAYLYLAELAFLADVPPEKKTGEAWQSHLEQAQQYSVECVAQALEMRPYNGQVLMAAGRIAMAQGDFEAALDYWKKSFHRDEGTQIEIVRLLAQYVPAQLADFIQESFDPNIDGLRRIASVLAEYQLKEDEEKILTVLANRLVARATEADNRKRVEDWLAASSTFRNLGQEHRMVECLQAAKEAAPYSFEVRIEYAAWLLSKGKPHEALTDLESCALMRPKNQKVQRLIEQAERDMISRGRFKQVGASSQELAPTFRN